MNPSDAEAVAKARVLVVEDHPFFREGVIQLLNSQPDMMCCAQADTLAGARIEAARLKPQLVLLDLRLGHADGIEFIKCLKAEFPGTPVLVLSHYDQPLMTERALRAGARGYVLKEEAADEVLAAIRAVLKGELYVSRKLAMGFLSQMLRAGSKLSGPGLESASKR